MNSLWLLAIGAGVFVAMTQSASANSGTPDPNAPDPNAPDPNAPDTSGDPRIVAVRAIAQKYNVNSDLAVAAWQLAQTQALAIGIDPSLLMAIWHQESRFNPNAKNPSDPSYGLGEVQPFWVDGRIGLFGDAVSLMDATFNAQASAHVLMYFQGQTVLADARPGSASFGQALLPYRYFSFPDEADIYNVGESQFQNGHRNMAYQKAVSQFYTAWSPTR